MSSIEKTSGGVNDLESHAASDNKDIHIFNAYHDADLVLQTSDGKDIWVHKLILGRASSVFRDMFQSSDAELKVPISEPADIIIDILEFIYPDFRPKGFQVKGTWRNPVSDPARLVQIDRFKGLLELTLKYDMSVLQGRIADAAMTCSFVESCPLDCFGLANRYGMSTYLTSLQESASTVLSASDALLTSDDVKRVLKAGIISGEEYFDLIQEHM